jgi:adenosylcobinamide-phosphate synthase
MWRTDAFQFLVAVGIDLFLGDPQGWPHLTRLAGRLITFWEPPCEKTMGRTILGGALLWGAVGSTMLCLYFIVRSFLELLHPAAAWLWDAFVIYQSLAAKDLDRHARSVHIPLAFGDLAAAREKVGQLVGRDTDALNEEGVSRAAVEAVAESTTDGDIAPLFWAAIGGAPAALLYRTANTLDSMVGHRNDQYELMGKVSALADDLLGFIPARLCAFASMLPRGLQHMGAILSDAGKHASPNAGWSEAAAAWALNIRLGGTNYYDGMPFSGPVFNPRAPEPQPSDIPRVLQWFWSVVLLCVLLFASGLYLRDRQQREPDALMLPPPVSSRAEYDPILKRDFVQTPEQPPIVKLPGKISRPDSNGDK